MVTIKASIFFENAYWIALIERTDKEGFAVASHVFGAEPSDQEIYQFVLEEYESLNFGKPKEFKLEVKRINPKRLQREVRQEMEKFKSSTKPATFAQDYMREELEKNKLERKQRTSAQKKRLQRAAIPLKAEKEKGQTSRPLELFLDFWYAHGHDLGSSTRPLSVLYFRLQCVC